MTGSNRVRAIIFDVDGLLLDTESAIAAVTKDILQSYNVKYDPTFLEPLGRPPRDAVQLLIDYYKLPHSVDDYLAMSGPILEEKYPQCRAMFGARRLVEHLHGHNIPSAFATSSTRRSLTFKTEHHKEWFSLIMGGVTCDDVDVGRGKPAPDLFFKAAELLKQTIKKRGEEDLQYHEILVFEDSPNGIEAAKAAGMLSVAVPSHPSSGMGEEGKKRDEQLFMGCTLMIPHLLAFDPQLFGLPAFRDTIAVPSTTTSNVAVPIEPPLVVEGEIVRGFGRGSSMLKIPTANLPDEVVASVVPLNLSGVFFGFARVQPREVTQEEESTKSSFQDDCQNDGIGTVHKTVLSVGWNPQFANEKKTIEPHIMYNFDRQLYGHVLRKFVISFISYNVLNMDKELTIVGFLRNEAKYDSLEALIEAIHQDISNARELLDLEAFKVFENHAVFKS